MQSLRGAVVRGFSRCLPLGCMQPRVVRNAAHGTSGMGRWMRLTTRECDVPLGAVCGRRSYATNTEGPLHPPPTYPPMGLSTGAGSTTRPYRLGQTVTSTSVLKAIVFDAKGEPSWSEYLKTDLASQLGLQTRDLRILEFRKQQSTIVVRPSVIIVNLGTLKVLIRANSVILCDPNNPEIQEFIYDLQDRLRANDKSDSLPYEFKVLEEVHISVLHSLSSKLYYDIRPAITNQLSALTEPDNPELDKRDLMRFLSESKRLAAFEARVEDIRRAIDEVLNNDEDMAHMYLSTRAETGQLRRTEQHEEVEMLLENYLKQVEEIAAEVSQLKSFIKLTEDIININLDSQRNTMMRLELKLTMGTVSVAACGLLAASFGMNLDNSFEGNPYAFPIFTGILFASTAMMYGMLLRMGRRRHLW
eukprot:Opistho-1_new@98150